MNSKRIVIVGAGVGGLAVALRLAHRGHDVTVLEQNSFVGGRNSGVTCGQCQFDGGPTLLMMLDPFRKLFADVGEDFDRSVNIVKCDPSYRVFYRDGCSIDATADRKLMAQRIETLSGEQDARRYPKFLEELQRLYDEAVPHFVRNNYRRLADYISPSQISRVVRHRMLGNLARRIKKRFRDPKLRMLFSFQTMYLGLSPYDAPWVYATLAYMEYGEGIYYPMGGLRSLSETIAEMAKARGARIRLGCKVQSIESAQVTLEGGESVPADIIIANADLPYAERELASTKALRKLRYSCSAHLMYIDYEGELELLKHHNVFFGRDFEGNLKDLFHSFQMPRDPAFYACVSSRTDSDAAPDGRLNLSLLIPVPNLNANFRETDFEALEREVFARLHDETGFDQKNVRQIKRRSVADWQREFNLDRGAAFGISHDLFQSAFMRPKNQSRQQPNLFFVGASTVPGNGLPMVLISAELVESRLIEQGLVAA